MRSFSSCVAAEARPLAQSATTTPQARSKTRRSKDERVEAAAGFWEGSYNRRVDPRPVGVFDSGVGGLTVLHECLVTMPHEDFVYVACNTATSAAMPQLQEELDVPVVGVITPEAHAAVQATRNRRIGLLATEATVAAGRYADLVRALDAGVELIAVACPRLVPLIEGDEPFAAETIEAVREYAELLKAAGVDTV